MGASKQPIIMLMDTDTIEATNYFTISKVNDSFYKVRSKEPNNKLVGYISKSAYKNRGVNSWGLYTTKGDCVTRGPTADAILNNIDHCYYREYLI